MTRSEWETVHDEIEYGDSAQMLGLVILLGGAFLFGAIVATIVLRWWA